MLDQDILKDGCHMIFLLGVQCGAILDCKYWRTGVCDCSWKESRGQRIYFLGRIGIEFDGVCVAVVL